MKELMLTQILEVINNHNFKKKNGIRNINTYKYLLKLFEIEL